jgi:hypothetical protein
MVVWKRLQQLQRQQPPHELLVDRRNLEAVGQLHLDAEVKQAAAESVGSKRSTDNQYRYATCLIHSAISIATTATFNSNDNNRFSHRIVYVATVCIQQDNIIIDISSVHDFDSVPRQFNHCDVDVFSPTILQ